MRTAYLLLKDTPQHDAGEVFVRLSPNDLLWEAVSGKMPCIPEEVITKSPSWYHLIGKVDANEHLSEMEKMKVEAEAFLSNTSDVVVIKIENDYIYFKKGNNKYAFSAEYIFKKLASLI